MRGAQIHPAAGRRRHALATGGATASAGTGAQSGVLHLYEIGGVSNTDTDVFTGLFTDYGVDHVSALDHGNVNKMAPAPTGISRARSP